MRLCRFEQNSEAHFGFYTEDAIGPLSNFVQKSERDILSAESLVDLLPGGKYYDLVISMESRVSEDLIQRDGFKLEDVNLLVPIPNPSKLLLLAGNYAKHVEESGGRAEEREKTFPYVFMKPPSTTLTNPGDPVRIPACSPDQIDWELELGVVIGTRCSGVTEEEALNFVAGYTVVNDISDRAFRPNPQRAERSRDPFFDWLHGKWHDTFCPMGPCILPASDFEDPQNFQMQLHVNGQIEQDSSTAEMVFPVAAVVSFISNFVTLEPGDIISTGTPAGVGKAKGKFLKAGDTLTAKIEGIGVLENPVV